MGPSSQVEEVIKESTLSTGGRSGQGGQEWTTKARMLGGAGHSALEGGVVGNDAIDMEVHESLLAFFAEEEVAILGVVHEEVFGEDGVAGGVAEEVEVGFQYLTFSVVNFYRSITELTSSISILLSTKSV